MPNFLGFSHVDLTVTDLKQSGDWYASLFELQTVLEGHNDEHKFSFRYLMAQESQTIIGLMQHDEATSGAFDPRRLGLDHLSLAVADRDELRRWEAQLQERDIAHSPIEEQPVGAGLTFKDPDGIALELYVLGAAESSEG